ncbi:hypothetical protein [Streptomyces sp. NPDC098781]|uniref:hypothetical protein n=1 Tax=Streptomyces sp. NPDC098781 TaxID=3366097 RepID=UPI0038200E8D
MPVAAILAVGLLPLLAACSSADPATDGQTSAGQTTAEENGELAVPADADPETKKRYLLQNALASCMKKAGFTYQPFVPPKSLVAKAIDGSDYALAKEYRQKYGFGIFASVVYPGAPGTSSTDGKQESQDPNADYISKLTPAQQTAYHEALSGASGNGPMDMGQGGCKKKAWESVEGPLKPGQLVGATNPKDARADEQALNGDPQLVELAQSYASCLRGHGIKVTTTQPTGIGDTATRSVSAKLPATGLTGMSKETALPQLTQEIKTALQDLECGKEFRAAYFPKLKKHPRAGGKG